MWDRFWSTQNALSRAGTVPYFHLGTLPRIIEESGTPSPFLPIPWDTAWAKHLVRKSQHADFAYIPLFSVSPSSRSFSMQMPSSVFKVPLSSGCSSTKNSQYLPHYQRLKFYVFKLSLNISQSTFSFLIMKYLKY